MSKIVQSRVDRQTEQKVAICSEISRARDDAILQNVQRGNFLLPYDQAVSSCRKSLETILPSGKDAEEILSPLISFAVGAKRTKVYSKLSSNLRQITNFPHHYRTGEVPFRRVEAHFVVRTTENWIALLGGLSPCYHAKL